MLSNKIVYGIFARCARLSFTQDLALRDRIFENIRRASMWHAEFDLPTESYRGQSAVGVGGHWIRYHAFGFFSGDWREAANEGANLLCPNVFTRNMATAAEACLSYYAIAVPILRETILAQIDACPDADLRLSACFANVSSPFELRVEVKRFLG